jgi:hypothetical protein
MKFFVLVSPSKKVSIFNTVEQAHAALVAFAKREGLDVHLHAGGWAGNAYSTAYTKGGSDLLDVVAFVRAGRPDDLGHGSTRDYRIRF